MKGLCPPHEIDSTKGLNCKGFQKADGTFDDTEYILYSCRKCGNKIVKFPPKKMATYSVP